MKCQSLRDYLVEYAKKQKALCMNLSKKFKSECDFLVSPEKSGVLTADNGLWEYQRHGSGVEFTCVKTGEVVDAHIKPFDEPDAIDAWRICLNIESAGIFISDDHGMAYSGDNCQEFDRLLGALRDVGFLRRKPRSADLYEIASVLVRPKS